MVHVSALCFAKRKRKESLGLVRKDAPDVVELGEFSDIAWFNSIKLELCDTKNRFVSLVLCVC